MALGTGSMGWRVGALAAVLVAAPVSAQSLWTPSTDPVSISRSGAGVAFGRSLEAAGLNPALLPTLVEPRAAHFGLGLAMESHQVTPQSNQITYFSSERNRFMPAFGLAWKVGDRMTLGLQLTDAFRRNGRLSQDAPARFDGLALDLGVRRLEAQAGLALSPAFSVGVGVGVLHVDYSNEAPVRAILPGDPAQSLVEIVAGQKAKKAVPSYTAGFRWALSPRWTVAGAFRSGVDTRLDLEAYRVGGPLRLVGSDGHGQPTLGIEPAAEAFAATLRPLGGDSRLILPAQLQLGVRQRVNQLLTWEVDLYAVSTDTRLPGTPGFTGASGSYQVLQGDVESRGGVGLRGFAEFTISKTWQMRIGLSLDPPVRKDEDADVLLNGTRTAAFSAGMSWKGLGGEVSLGYQFRQTQDRESSRMDSTWSSSGYRRTGTPVRIEAQGHLVSLGYKVAF